MIFLRSPFSFTFRFAQLLLRSSRVRAIHPRRTVRRQPSDRYLNTLAPAIKEDAELEPALRLELHLELTVLVAARLR
jgi:hypothetical protein